MEIDQSEPQLDPEPRPSADDPEDQDIPATYPFPRPLDAMLAGFAGIDLTTVPKYAGANIEHERRKLVRAGASVLIPAVVGFVSMYCFLGIYVSSHLTRLLGALLTAALLLAIDSIIVTTLKKGGGIGTFARVAVSVCIGIVFSEPLLLDMYSKTIAAYITQTVGNERGAKERSEKATLRELDRELSDTNQRMATAQEQLETYSPRNIGQKHLREKAERHNEALKASRASKNSELENLTAERDALLKQRQETGIEIERKLVQLQQEYSGQRESRTGGRGPVYSLLREEINALRGEQRNVDGRVFVLNRRIDTVVAEKNENPSAPITLKWSAEDSEAGDINVLSAEERSERDRLTTEISGYQSSIAAAQRQRQDVDREIARLPQQFSLEARNDALAQTRALYEIISTNWVLRVKVVTLFLLLFSLDLMPIIIKLTLRTGYDEYQESLAHKRALAAAASRDAYEASLFAQAMTRNQRIGALCASAAAELRQFTPQPTDGRAVHSIYARGSGAIDQSVGETLTDVRNTKSAGGRSAWADAIASMVKRLSWFFKTQTGV